MKMNSEIPLEAYHQISTIREFRERIHKEFAMGEIATTYRPPGEVSDEKLFLDALKFFRARVIAGELLTNEELVAIDAEIEALIDEAVTEARSSSLPVSTF